MLTSGANFAALGENRAIQNLWRATCFNVRTTCLDSVTGFYFLFCPGSSLLARPDPGRLRPHKRYQQIFQHRGCRCWTWRQRHGAYLYLRLLENRDPGCSPNVLSEAARVRFEIVMTRSTDVLFRWNNGWRSKTSKKILSSSVFILNVRAAASRFETYYHQRFF